MVRPGAEARKGDVLDLANGPVEIGEPEQRPARA